MRDKLIEKHGDAAFQKYKKPVQQLLEKLHNAYHSGKGGPHEAQVD